MLKRFFVPVILALLVAGFWLSPEFQTIAGGVAIFLFGMLMLERGFELFSGGVLEKVMKRSTDSVFKSLFFGIFSTTVMQSSSLVSVIAISFLSAGLIPLVAGIGIIFGANIGTTTGSLARGWLWPQGQSFGLCHADAGLRSDLNVPEIEISAWYRFGIGGPRIPVFGHPLYEGGF